MTHSQDTPPQPQDRPVIVFGSVRAGTTMFRLMLNAHPDLVEIGENRYLVDCLKDGRGERLCYDIDKLEMDRVFRMRGLMRPDELDGTELVAALVAQLKEGQAGPPVLTFHADANVVDRLFPGARYLHIYRDPRAVAASVVRFGWAGNHYYGADFWLASEQSWEQFRKTLAPERYVELCYEDLVLNPQVHLRQVCELLEIDFTEKMLGYNKSSNYDKPDVSLTTRWKTKLTPAQIALVELRCGPLMEARGYAREAGEQAPPNALKKSLLRVDNKLRKVAAEIAFYGIWDYALEKLFRLPGFRRHHTGVVTRMHETVNSSLK